MQCVLVCVLCMCSTVASAQEQGDSEPEVEVVRQPPASEDELFKTDQLEDRQEEDKQQQDMQGREEAEAIDDETSREQLQQAGFRFGDYGGTRRRSSAFLWALGPGLLLHGAGHLYLEEEETAIVLVLMEVGGLGLLGVGALVPWVYQGRFASTGAARPLMYTGMGALIASYVIDVVGVVRGESPLIYSSPLKRKGVFAEVGYEFMQARYYPLRNVLQARVGLDSGTFMMSASTLQDVSLQTSRYRGEVGWRLWQLEETEHQVYMQGRGDLLQLRDIGRFSRGEASLELGGVLDLGSISPHLRKMYIGIQGGYGYQWYAFPKAVAPEVDVLSDDPSELEWGGEGIGLIPVNVFGGMSFSDRLHVQLSYRRRDGAFLSDVQRVIGVPGLHMDYRSGKNFDLTLDAQYGAGFMLGAGLRIWLYEDRRN